MVSPLLPSSRASLLLDPPAPQPPTLLAGLLRLWEAWKSFGRAMGEFQSRILLGIFYFLVVTPFGLGMRIFGDPLLLHRARRLSGWMPRKDTPPANLDTANKQF
jgi:hypothetical protein